ncbi:MAG: HNH endonuclease [Rhodococcus sp. (in: high G+C Gram-positive bacteria)]|uniref:HNH endonuclease n=1 Tax=Nocardiaceae TaxID=85025 RepID=UPI001E45A407|nr:MULTISPECIES: HNH endonuclease [Rhodococcus]MCZ4278716.1 HNH endonuclease [Rhodococcus yunnanensis]
MSDDLDTRLRDSAMEWLKLRTSDGLESISSTDLLDFTFDDQHFRLMDPQRGIRKPKELAAALSIRTVYRPDGAKRPYEDEMGDDGLLRYKWRGEDLDHPENRALRAAMELELPLIWFFGVGVAMYQPIFPVYLLAEEPERHQFVIIPGAIRGLVDATSPAESQLRRYVMAESKRRLHQPVFRATVMRAYETRCAVCSLAHGQLLDAAHIVPDSDEAGIPTVRNGLAMCKIHHAAYDAHIMGVSPDYVVKIRADLLDEIDGPMLQYGLKERHDQKLMVLPSVRAQRPDRDLLALSYDRFRSA